MRRQEPALEAVVPLDRLRRTFSHLQHRVALLRVGGRLVERPALRAQFVGDSETGRVVSRAADTETRAQLAHAAFRRHLIDEDVAGSGQRANVGINTHGTILLDVKIEASVPRLNPTTG
jgi:hypothetical protein